MIGTLRSELLKQRSTRTTLLLFVTMVALVALVVAMHVLAPSAATLATRSMQLRVFQVGSGIGMLFAGLVGAISITAELRYGTIRPTFLVSPRRGPVIAAKLVVGLLTGIIFGLLSQGIMAAAATAAFSARGVVNTLGTGDYVQILLGSSGRGVVVSDRPGHRRRGPQPDRRNRRPLRLGTAGGEHRGRLRAQLRPLPSRRLGTRSGGSQRQRQAARPRGRSARARRLRRDNGCRRLGHDGAARRGLRARALAASTCTGRRGHASADLGECSG